MKLNIPLSLMLTD